MYDPDEGYLHETTWRTGQVAMLLIVPIIIPFVASYIVAPMYAPRYTLPASFGLYLLIGAGTVNLPNRRTRRAILVGFLIGSAPLVGAYYLTDSVEDWDGASDAIDTEANPGDLLIIQPGWIEPYFDYYYDGPPLDRLSIGRASLTAPERNTLDERIETHDRVWVVSYHDGPSPSLQSGLSGRERTVIYREGVLTVHRYESTV